MPWTRVVVAVLLVGAFVLPAAAPASASPPMVRKINQARRAHGVRPLRYSHSLGHSSARFAHHLMAIDYFGHASRIHASRRFSALGECLARQSGWRLRRSRVVRGWMGSPVHRMILLSRRFNRVGAAPARGIFRGRRATIWVVQVGRR